MNIDRGTTGALRRLAPGAVVGLLAIALGAAPVRGAPEDPRPEGNGFPAPLAVPVDADGAAPPPAAAGGAGGGVLELSLARAVELGLAANHTLQAARYDTPIAHQAFLGAVAAFDDLLTASFEVSHEETPSTFTFTGNKNDVQDSARASFGVTRRLLGGGTASLLYRADRIDTNSFVAAVDPAYAGGLTLEVVRPLLRGAGAIATLDIRRAQNGVASARAGFETSVETLLLQIVNAYWELVFADADLAAKRSSFDVSTELLADAQARLDAEVGTPLEVAEARAGVGRRRSEVLRAENARGTVEDRLLSLIAPFGTTRLRGVHVVPTDAAASDAPGLPDPAEEQRFLQVALQSRPEVRGTRADISNRSLDAIEAFDAIRPQLDVTGRVVSSGLDTAFGDSTKSLFDGSAVSASIGVQFSMFVGQRAAWAGWRAAGWARRQAVLRLRELENQIVVEVRGALRNLSTARAQLEAGRVEVAAAREDWEGEKDKLDQGKSTPFQVLQKEDDLTGARTRLARAAADVRIAESGLWKAVGLLAQNLHAKAPRWPPCCR